MRLEVHDNPNCAGIGEAVFVETGSPRLIKGIRAAVGRADAVCAVAGVGEGGAFGPAYACKVEDSGEGTAFLIFGGAWGIRIKPWDPDEAWDLSNPRQWGEAYKVYGSEEDIFYA